ncbi:DivIVA domain-containing protein [Aerococcaceae bacterium NML210727]|nr:DivIVA domain-containing protein [Aerococcaceae bacterium NML210727]MCW6654272.1 DivIVA domain-containing protein [Aerococcaceae bacterium NML201296]
MEQITHIGLSILGYNRQQVDRLIEQKDARLKQLEQEIAVFKAQFEQLEQQLQTYIHMEDELKAGILDARMAGKTILENSTQEATRIVERTNEQVIQYKETIAYQSQELVNSGTSLKDRMNEMKQELLTTIQAYQKMIESTDFDAMYPSDASKKLSLQLEGLEAEEPLSVNFNSQPVIENSLTQEERMELKGLIQDVMDHELEDEEVYRAVGEAVAAPSQSSSAQKKLVKFTHKKSR